MKSNNAQVHLTFLLPGDGYSGGIRVTMQMGNTLLKRGYAVRIAYRKHPWFSRENLLSFARSVKFLCCGIRETRWLRHFNGKKTPFTDLNDLQFRENEIVIATGEHTIDELNGLRGSLIKLRYCHGFVEREPEQMHKAWGGPIPAIAVSPGLVATVEKYCTGPVLGIVPNGISRDEHFIEDRTRDGIGFIFHGSTLKGGDVAVALAKALRGRFPGTPFYVFGSFPRPDVLSPHEYTRYPSIEKAREIYNRCKIWLVTSRDEGFCLPILEAMACGCAVISSRHTNAAELIQDGINAFTVPYGDLESYLNRIDRLLTDEPLRKRIVEEGLKTVERFTWENAGGRMEEIVVRLTDSQQMINQADGGTKPAVGRDPVPERFTA